jgi:hypothetical protein
LCCGHYKRWRRHGDPAAGGITPGTAHEFYRELLKYEGDDCVQWPFGTVGGYGNIHIGRKSKVVSRLLCEDTHGPPPTPEHHAAHSCGNGRLGCVNRHHLRWATPAENLADRVHHGTTNHGERNGSAKLSIDDVRQIRALKDFMVQTEISAMFGVSFGTVSKIHKRRIWAWLD